MAQRRATVALQEFETVVALLKIKHKDNQEETVLLSKLQQVADDAIFELNVFDTSPRSEWMGGDSRDAKNFKWREPHCCGLGSSRRYLN